MADHLLDDPDSKDGVETPEDPLSGDLNDLEDDTSLLDAGLTDLDGNGDHDDLLAPTPTDDSEHLLDNATDDDPVRGVFIDPLDFQISPFRIKTHRLHWRRPNYSHTLNCIVCISLAGDRGHQGKGEGNGGRGREAQGNAGRGRQATHVH